MSNPNLLHKEEIAAKLRALYESRGFRRTTPGKFEDYSLYMENRNFFDCDHVITFMDMNGSLLALKPDVTLSIVKNIPSGELPAYEKLYYLDEVYRAASDTRDYKVLNQIGVELIGRQDAFSNIEAIDLALDSLRLMNQDYVLDISHLGFVICLFDSIGLSHGIRKRVLEAVHAKSTHELAALLEDSALPNVSKEKILTLTELHGPFDKVLPRLQALCCNEPMQTAYEELQQLAAAIQYRQESHCFFDFSVVNDLDYYNGLLFQGYVKGVPKAIVSGGRYDNLLQRMKKKSSAIGFGINLSEYALYYKSGVQSDFDVLIHYAADCDYCLLLEKQKEFANLHTRVRLEPLSNKGETTAFRAVKQYIFTQDNVLREVTKC